MNTLIIYATKNGSVAEVAKLISKEINGKVDLINAHENKVEDISSYDNILIGSSVYFGQIDRKIKNFIFLHRPEIMKRKFGIFIMAGEKDEQAMERQLKDTIPNDIYTKANVLSVIGSEIKLNQFSWLVRFILKHVKKIKSSYKNIDSTKIKDFAKNFNT